MAYYQPQHFYPQQPQPILNGYYGVPEQFLVPFYSTAIPQPVPATVYPSIKDSSEHKLVESVAYALDILCFSLSLKCTTRAQ